MSHLYSCFLSKAQFKVFPRQKKEGSKKVLIIYLVSIACTVYRHAPAASTSEPEFVNFSRSPGIDSQPGGPVRQRYLTFLPAKLHRLAGSGS
jgi:hypothetical protein